METRPEYKITKCFFTIPAALEQFPITEDELHDLIQANQKKRSVIMVRCQHQDELQIAIYQDIITQYISDRDVEPENFKDLEGKLIYLSEAEEKYKFSPGVLSRWSEDGRIEIKGEHQGRKFLNEAEIAFWAKKREIEGTRKGKRILPPQKYKI